MLLRSTEIKPWFCRFVPSEHFAPLSFLFSVHSRGTSPAGLCSWTWRVPERGVFPNVACSRTWGGGLHLRGIKGNAIPMPEECGRTRCLANQLASRSTIKSRSCVNPEPNSPNSIKIALLHSEIRSKFLSTFARNQMPQSLHNRRQSSARNQMPQSLHNRRQSHPANRIPFASS